MSLHIDSNTIARLLLQDGMWYEVLPGSFTVDVFDWTDSKGLVADGGSVSVNIPLALAEEIDPHLT